MQAAIIVCQLWDPKVLEILRISQNTLPARCYLLPTDSSGPQLGPAFVCKTGLCSSQSFQILSFLCWSLMKCYQVSEWRNGEKFLFYCLMRSDHFFLKREKASGLPSGCKWKILMLGTISWSTHTHLDTFRINTAWQFLPELVNDCRWVVSEVYGNCF